MFRDGCKGEQVLQRRRREGQDAAAVPAASGPAVIKPRPHSLSGTTYRSETPIGTAFITVNETDEHEPFEVFVQVGKGGSDTMAVAEALGRLISLTLRLPSPMSPQRRLEEVISQLSRIGGAQPLGFGKGKMLSLPDALARTLAEHTGQLKPASEAPPAARAHDQRASAISARSAGRRRSSTRKAARSVSPAASTSAERRPVEAGEPRLWLLPGRELEPPRRIPGMFSGGSYDDVARWLRNFLTAHAKRVDPRIEIVMEAGDELEGTWLPRARCGWASASASR